MDNKYIKEKSRYVYIRERSRVLKEKPKAAPLPLKHMAIQKARQQANQGRQEENSYAVDEIENSTILVADKSGQTLKRARREFAVKAIRRKESSSRNTSLQEIYFRGANYQNADELLQNTSLQETYFRETAVSKKARTDIPYKTIPTRQIRAEKNTSLEETYFKQAYKEQGREFVKRKRIKQTKAKAERKAALADKIKKAIERSASESGKSLLLLGGIALIAIIPLLVVLGIAGSIFTVDVDKAPVSEEVKAYAGVIQVYAMEHGIPEYAELIMAVMMQESGGRGSDPMQASESAFNTEYPNYPNGITDSEYSINVGIQALADVLSLAGVTDIEDTESLYIALQAYNFGPGYISYAYNNGGHSELAALAFSEMMAERMGWESYGDPYYVQHVMRYVAAP